MPEQENTPETQDNTTPQNSETAPTHETIKIGFDTEIVVRSTEDDTVQYKPTKLIEAFVTFPDSFKMETPNPLVQPTFEIPELGVTGSLNDPIQVKLTERGYGILKEYAQSLSESSKGILTSEFFIKCFQHNSENPQQITIEFWRFFNIFGNELKKVDIMTEESAQIYQIIDGPIRIITNR